MELRRRMLALVGGLLMGSAATTMLMTSTQKNGELQSRAVVTTTVGNPSSSALASEDEPQQQQRAETSEDGPEREPVTADSKGQPHRGEESPVLRVKARTVERMPSKAHVADADVAAGLRWLPAGFYLIGESRDVAGVSRIASDSDSGVSSSAVTLLRLEPCPQFAECEPPATFRFPLRTLTADGNWTGGVTVPMDAPVRFGGETTYGGKLKTSPEQFTTGWLWIKAGEGSRPCTQAERDTYAARTVNPCDARIGDSLGSGPRFRIVEVE